jgi:hypothetical protein
MMKNIYAIRKGILKGLKEYAAGGIHSAVPMPVEDLIVLHGNPELMYAAAEDIRVEWQELKNFGYIEPIQGYEGKYCKISKKGLEQLSIEFDQDYFIHGPSAIRSKP